MKTGKVAKLFGIDPKTVTGWVDEFIEFFSPEARGDGRTQREFLTEDLIVLNTIKADRTNRIDIETTRARLNSGIRDTVLPPEAPHMDRQNALAVYGQLKAMETALATANSEIERLRSIEKEIQQKYHERESELQQRAYERENDLNKEIRKLEREIGRLEEVIRRYQEKDDD